MSVKDNESKTFASKKIEYETEHVMQGWMYLLSEDINKDIEKIYFEPAIAFRDSAKREGRSQFWLEENLRMACINYKKFYANEQ